MRIWIMAIVVSCAAWAQGGGTILGIVLDPAGAPLGGSSVRLTGDQVSREIKADSEGKFSFANVPPGRVRVFIDCLGFFPRILRADAVDGQVKNLGKVELLVGFPYAPPAEIRVVFDSAMTGTFTMRIRGEEALTELRVVLKCISNRKCDSVARITNGEVRFEDLPEGKYALTISAKGYYKEELEFYAFGGIELRYPDFDLYRCPNPRCDPRYRPILLE